MTAWGGAVFFLTGVVVFLLGSVLAGASSDAAYLIASRLVQGIGAAMILPSTLSSINAIYTGKDRSIAFAVWGSTIGGMAAIGPLVGSWLTSDFSWRWAFLINIPICIVILAGTLRYFSINNQVSPLDAKSKMVLDLLGLNEAYYEAEVGFDSVKRQRYIRIRLNVAVELSIDFKAGKRQIALNKNDTILLWQYWHNTAKEIAQQMDANNFDTIQSSQTEDGDYLLTISRLKRP